MGEKEWNVADIFDLFGDALARQILVLASRKPMSADELADHLEASSPTIYRRLNTLADYDLVDESVEFSEDGNHYRTFETTLRRLTFEIDSGGYNINFEVRRSLVDQFEAFWEDLNDSSPEAGLDAAVRPDGDSRPEGTDG